MEKLYIDKTLKESNKIEFKSAKGGLPHSFFETYSSFLNTKGGIIYLGISEINKNTIVSSMLSIEDANKLIIDLFNLLNNSQKVSVNLLSNDDVIIKEFDGYPVVEIKLKPASNEYKPVYINNNILTGTYRRNNEGDYKCSPSEIKSMLRDADDKPQDLFCIDSLSLDALSKDTISAYKTRLLSLKPEHVFALDDENKFLEYLGAIRVGSDGKFHPTRAGLLMFGYSYKIVYEFPEYFVDYQEHYSEDANIRWTDRITSDTGDWSGNLYDFYSKVSNKLTSELKVPFKMNEITRIDETIMHKAIREALCNAISNSDFYQPEGLVIKKYKDYIEFNNPGCLKISKERAFKGGESNARNKTILKMFSLVGIGERAGSGIPLILKACSTLNYSQPLLEDSYNPDRTKLVINFFADDLKVESNEETLSENERLIISFLSNNGKQKSSEIAEFLKLGITTTKNMLYKLSELGFISSEGQVKNKKYFIINKLDDTNC